VTGRLATGLCLISCFTRSAYAPSKDRTVLFDTATLLKRLNVERARDRSPSPAASFARRDGSVQLLRARSKGSSVLCLFFGVGERGSLFVVYRAYPRRWLASRRKGGRAKILFNLLSGNSRRWGKWPSSSVGRVLCLTVYPACSAGYTLSRSFPKRIPGIACRSRT